MATISPIQVAHPFKGKVHIYLWSQFTENDTCEPIACPDKADKSMVVEGTFNGGTCVLKGTVNPTEGADLYTMHDSQGNSVSFTAAKIEDILVNAYQYAPAITAGTGMLLDAYLMIVGH